VGRANGLYEKKAGQPIDWKAFNAGPSAMEALLAGQLDIAFVGPNPAVNAFMRSKGAALRIIAGVASGGAALVVDPQAGIRSVKDFKGKKLASPELGNTQDVALRHWLKQQGLVVGKDVQVIPTKNADILQLLQRHQIAGAWVPEPWVTRLQQEAKATVFLDERNLWDGRKFPTAVLVVRSEFLRNNSVVVKRFLEAHIEVTDWIAANPQSSRKVINEQLARLAGKALPEAELAEAFGRMLITFDPLKVQLLTSAGWAGTLGFLPRESVYKRSDLPKIFDLSLLNELLRERRKPQVK
jgi:NitT/TauT family transport system substrate-binding protein